ncbi:MAG: arginine--tRNA ligase [Pseudomonadota bacterium]
MSSIAEHLTALVSQAFEAEGLPRDLGMVRTSDRPDLAQFQCNGAMPAAKLAKKPPRHIAEAVAARLQDRDLLAKLEVVGPGFLNMDVTDSFIADHLNAVAPDPRLGCPSRDPARTVVLDYGGCNIAKAMHVGHLRASVIGDTLRRLFEFSGDKTIGDIHMGDWGLPMGMLITEIKREQPDLPYFDEAQSGPYPADSPVSIEDLERLYPQAAGRCKENPDDLDEARKATAELQSGRAGFLALWQHFFDVSVAAMEPVFDQLNVHFDLWYGEAIVNDLIPPIVEQMGNQGISELSEGATIVRIAQEGDKAEIPPLILIKSDGAMMYSTTDLGTIEHRRQNIDQDLSLYVVDQRQHLHFEQVFRAARKAGINGKAEMEHIGFGTMNGPDGKPFKTRSGGVMKLQQLIAMAIEAADKRLTEAGLAADMSDQERQEIVRQVAIAAIRFADLSNFRLSNYIFDLDRFTRFEGKTGPYLLYAAVRMKSLLRKAKDKGLAPGQIEPSGALERDLMLALARLPEPMATAYERRAPNELCDFAFGLAQEFSRFYQNCHILTETDATLQASRLGLVEVTLKELLLVLSILGIEVPERM